MPTGGASPKKPGMGDGIGVRSNVSARVGAGNVSVGLAKRKGVGVATVNDAESTVGAGGGETRKFCTM